MVSKAVVSTNLGMWQNPVHQYEVVYHAQNRLVVTAECALSVTVAACNVSVYTLLVHCVLADMGYCVQGKPDPDCYASIQVVASV